MKISHTKKEITAYFSDRSSIEVSNSASITDNLILMTVYDPVLLKVTIKYDHILLYLNTN